MYHTFCRFSIVKSTLTFILYFQYTWIKGDSINTRVNIVFSLLSIQMDLFVSCGEPMCLLGFSLSLFEAALQLSE